MNELREIIEAIHESDELLIMATVVDVVGSSYRRPTARMLIFPSGEHIGSISGGCLERDLCQNASNLTQAGPKLISFDTRRDSTNFNPRYNLGCSGIIYVLVERVTREERVLSRDLLELLDTKVPTTMATIYQSDLNALVGAHFRSHADIHADSEELAATFQQVLEDGRPTCCELESNFGGSRLLIERISPPKPLWIFGAGEDACSLAAMAWQLGWDVTIFDHQASQLTTQRFPNARMLCAPWHKAMDSLQATPDTAAVLITHSFDADKLLLPELLSSCISYVGVLGPKSRTGTVLQELHAAGKLPAAEAIDRLRAPVGLDLGGTNPAEIAISILGEIIALDNAREGGLLRQRQGPIHEPVRHKLIDLTASQIVSS